MDFMEEKYNDYIGICFKPIFGVPVEQEDTDKFVAYFDTMIPFLEKRLQGNKEDFIANTSSLTVADLKVFQSFICCLEIDTNPAPEDLKTDVRAKIAEKPKLKRYIAMLTMKMQPWIYARSPTPI